MLVDKKYKKEILKYLDQIDRKTKITGANKTNILNQLSEISLDLQYKKNIWIQPMAILIIMD